MERGGRPVFSAEEDNFSKVWSKLFETVSGHAYMRDMLINQYLPELMVCVMRESWHPEEQSSLPPKKQIIKPVKEYLDKNYGEKLESFDLKRFNKNLIDTIKLIFDKTVYQASLGEIVSNEIFRQSDKSNNNDIGHFHQRIFNYIDKCHVHGNGKEGGWDVIFENPDGIALPDGSVVHTVYVEMKNKHNTMNSASAGKTFIKMQDQLINDDDCACFLVEAIAQRSQNIKWETTVDKKNVGHKLIRRVSLDQFYALVTGQEDDFYQMCMALPSIIQKAVEELEGSIVPHDTVIDELKELAKKQNIDDENLAVAMAVYMLGVGSYKGF